MSHHMLQYKDAFILKEEEVQVGDAEIILHLNSLTSKLSNKQLTYSELFPH
jgi:hypothetical protein